MPFSLPFYIEFSIPTTSLLHIFIILIISLLVYHVDVIIIYGAHYYYYYYYYWSNKLRKRRVDENKWNEPIRILYLFILNFFMFVHNIHYQRWFVVNDLLTLSSKSVLVNLIFPFIPSSLIFNAYKCQMMQHNVILIPFIKK